MANLILDTRFNPFSYAELLAPVQAATEAHLAVEQEYGVLKGKASVWENLANELTDPKAYKTYKAYAQALELEADNLMRYGLSPSSKRRMLDMLARYNQDIVPIENAYKRRETLAEEQRKARTSNPTMLYQREASTISLDDFIDNPSLDYGYLYSGELLASLVGEMASALAKELTYGKGNNIDSYVGTMWQLYGYTKGQVLDAINNPNRAESLPVLNAIVELVIGASGIPTWGDLKTILLAYEYARRGLYKAIGEQKIDTYNIPRPTSSGGNSNKTNPLSGDIPIDIVEIASRNYLAAPEEFNADISKLGYTEEGRKVLKEVPILYLDTSNKNFAGIYGSSEYKAKLWHIKNGSPTVLYTRHLFISQVDNDSSLSKGQKEIIKDRLATYYDTKVIPTISSMTGVNLTERAKQGKTIHIKETNEAIRSMHLTSTPYVMSTLKVPMVDSDKTLKDLLPILTYGDDGSTSIKEIKGFDKDGNIQTTDRIVNSSDFIDDEDKVKGTPVFTLPGNPNSKGLFMLFNNKLYFIPGDKVGSIMKGVFNVDLPTLKQANALKQLLLLYLESLGYSSEDALYYYYNSEVGTKLESIINNSGGTTLRNTATGLGWKIKAKTYE